MSIRLSRELQLSEELTKVDVNSAVYHGGPPVPTRALKLLNFVDTNEKV